MPNNDDVSKIVEDVHVHSEISGVIGRSLVNPGTLIIDGVMCLLWVLVTWMR